MSDIFIYPSFCDTFGFHITEAMSFGLPVVGADRNSRKELINTGKTGFLARTPFRDERIQYYLENLEERLLIDLINKTEKLITNEKLRMRMSKECLSLFKSGGKFSIEKRNRGLREIYIEALKNWNGEKWIWYSICLSWKG